MSDQVVLQIVTQIMTLVGTIVTGVMAYYMAKLNTKAGDAVKNAKEVKLQLEETVLAQDTKLENIAAVTQNTNETGKLTFHLVDGGMSTQKRLYWIAMQRIAAGADATELDKDAAITAKEAYLTHELDQAKEGRRGAIMERVAKETQQMADTGAIKPEIADPSEKKGSKEKS